MNKAARREVEKAVSAIPVNVDYAVATLCAAHRAATTNLTQREIHSIAILHGLQDRFDIVNGCMVPKVPA